MVVLIKTNERSSVEHNSTTVYTVNVVISPQSQPAELCFVNLVDAVDFARKCIDDATYAVAVASSLQSK